MPKNQVENQALYRLQLTTCFDISRHLGLPARSRQTEIHLDPLQRWHAILSENRFELLFVRPDFTEQFLYRSHVPIQSIDFNRLKDHVLILGSGIDIVDFQGNRVNHFDPGRNPIKAVFSGREVLTCDAMRRVILFSSEGRKIWTYGKDFKTRGLVNTFKNLLTSTDFAPIDNDIEGLCVFENHLVIFIFSGNLLVLEKSGKRLVNYFADPKLETRYGLCSIYGENLFIVGERGLFCINVVRQMPAWQNTIVFEAYIRQASINEAGTRLAVLDSDNHLFIIDFNGHQLFQQKITDGEVTDCRISGCGDFLFILYGSNVLKTFKIVSHGDATEDNYLEFHTSAEVLGNGYFQVENKVNLEIGLTGSIETGDFSEQTAMLEVHANEDLILGDLCDDYMCMSQLFLNVSEDLHQRNDGPDNFSDCYSAAQWFPIDGLKTVFQVLNDRLFYFLTADGTLGAIDLKSGSVLFRNDFLKKNVDDGSLICSSLYGNSLYVYHASEGILTGMNWKGENVFKQQECPEISLLTCSINGNALYALSKDRKRLLMFDGYRGQLLRTKKFDARVDRIDFDYKLSKFIYSSSDIIRIESAEGRILVDRKLKSSILDVDINGAGNSFSFLIEGQCTNLNQVTSKLSNYPVSPLSRKLSVSLGGETGIVYSDASVKVIDFLGGSVLFEKDFDQLYDLYHSISGGNVCINMRDRVLILGDFQGKSLSQKTPTGRFMPSLNGEILYSVIENKGLEIWTKKSSFR